MRPSLLILASAALLLDTAAAQAAHGGRGMSHMSAPGGETVTPPTESLTPTLNPGALPGPAEFGNPPVNSGTIAPLSQQTITNQPNYGALPGNPGSATYDPIGALPSLDNPGSALAPLPGTSGAGFNSPSTNTGGF